MQVGATVGSGLELAQSTADMLRDLSAVSRAADATVNRIRTLLPVVGDKQRVNSPPSLPPADDPAADDTQVALKEPAAVEGESPPQGRVGPVGWTGRLLRPFAADGKRNASPERPSVRSTPRNPNLLDDSLSLLCSRWLGVEDQAELQKPAAEKSETETLHLHVGKRAMRASVAAERGSPPRCTQHGKQAD
jgi:hypothetical protein